MWPDAFVDHLADDRDVYRMYEMTAYHANVPYYDTFDVSST